MSPPRPPTSRADRHPAVARAVSSGFAFAAVLAAALVIAGCNDDTSDPADAAPEAGAPTPCGSGAATLQLGVDHPFVPTPDHRFPIDQGRQGGYHLDISLRATGALDPDHTDVELALFDGATRVAHHFTADWLLHIDPSGPWCDYPRARLVLLDPDDGLLTADRAAELVGRALHLDVSLRTPRGDAAERFTITPTEIRALR